LNNMAKMLLATGFIVTYSYVMETFMAFYSDDKYERFMMMNRMTGPYAPWYWLLVACNIVIPMTLLWSHKIRTNTVSLFLIATVVQIGMWLERFIIVVTSLHRDFMPSAWGMYYPTKWDWAVLTGSMGLFLALFYLFIRVMPAISIFEVRELVHKTLEENAH